MLVPESVVVAVLVTVKVFAVVVPLPFAMVPFIVVLPVPAMVMPRTVPTSVLISTLFSVRVPPVMLLVIVRLPAVPPVVTMPASSMLLLPLTVN